METTLQLFKALGDRNRLRIVAALNRHDELCACQITELLQVTGATASRHLSVLQHAGLVESRKEGRWVYYRLTQPGNMAPVSQWLEQTFTESDQLQQDAQELDRIIGITREALCRTRRGDARGPQSNRQR
jgi:ArsR family transcriptional regulator